MLPTGGVATGDIAVGADGNLWFTSGRVGTIGRISPGGNIAEFPIPSGGLAVAIARGPDGNVWYVQSDALIRVARDGSTTIFGATPPDPSASPQALLDLVAGPDRAIWFTANNPSIIGRFVPP